MKTKKMFLIMFILLIAVTLSACGGSVDAPSAKSALPNCSEFSKVLPYEAGTIFAFNDQGVRTDHGPHRLTVNEGDTMALGSGDFILYRANLASGSAVLYGENNNRDALGIAVEKCAISKNEVGVGFKGINVYPTQTFDELMVSINLDQGENTWQQWNNAINETRGMNIPADYRQVSVGVLVRGQLTFDLIVVPDGLIIPHDEDWFNPVEQTVSGITSFFVPPSEYEDALSRIEYVPQPGWKLQNTIEKTVNGGYFRIFILEPTVPVVHMDDLLYHGPTTWLLTESILTNNNDLISMSGFAGESLANKSQQIMVVIPINPYDEYWMIQYLSEMEPDLTSAGLYCPGLNNKGFYFEFNVFEGWLKYFFKPCQ